MILKEEDAAESTCCSLFKSSFNNAVAVKASEDCVCVCDWLYCEYSHTAGTISWLRNEPIDPVKREDAGCTSSNVISFL